MVTERVLAGPGIVELDMHVEYLPAFRPGPRSKHCHGGTIVSIGPKSVLWRPYNWHCNVRTALEAMRIDVAMHSRRGVSFPQPVAGLPNGDWWVWSLAERLAYAAEHGMASEETPAHAEDGDPLPDEERPFLAPGIVELDMHVEYLPGFRPGPRSKHCHGGTIVSVGPKSVLWRPLGWHTDLRSPQGGARAGLVKGRRVRASAQSSAETAFGSDLPAQARQRVPLPTGRVRCRRWNALSSSYSIHAALECRSAGTCPARLAGAGTR
ncbi:hypothetical protein [Streptomyces sp. NPDC000880]